MLDGSVGDTIIGTFCVEFTQFLFVYYFETGEPTYIVESIATNYYFTIKLVCTLVVHYGSTIDLGAILIYLVYKICTKIKYADKCNNYGAILSNIIVFCSQYNIDNINL